MLTLNSSIQLLSLLSNFICPLVRILAFFSTAPIFNNQNISKKTKIILSIVISWIIVPFLPDIHINLFSFSSVLLLLQQILIGIAFGFSVQILFSAVNLSGEIIGLQMGLSFATFLNIKNYNIGSSVVSRILNILILMLFLSVNAHLYLISVFVHSFYTIPINVNFFRSYILLDILKFSSFIFLNSVMFSLPIIIFLLLSNLIMSFINRLSPQISIFSVGFPLNLLIGIFMLYYVTSRLFPFFQGLLNQLIAFISHTF